MHFLRKLVQPRLRTMNEIQINKKYILSNVSYLESLHPETALFPVLKSNAYGHGLEQMMSILNKTWISHVCVDSLPEYYRLKKITNKKIVLIGEMIKENYKKLDFRQTIPCVYNIDTIHYLIWLRKKMTIHLFVNTWMNREWVHQSNLSEILELLHGNNYIDIDGVLSHLSDADGISDDNVYHTEQQIALFKSMHDQIVDAWFSPDYRYIGNSAGLLKIDDPFFTARRPWLALYGYNPLSPQDEYYKKWEKLQPALRIRSIIISQQPIQSWEWASYLKTRKASADGMLWTIPFGYTEWLPRNWSNKYVFSYGKWSKKWVQQVWNVCMNLCSIDCTWTWLTVGDSIELVSRNNGDEHSLMKQAERAWVISYEFLVNIDSWLRRTVV